jgi:hypothetical protein
LALEWSHPGFVLQTFISTVYPAHFTHEALSPALRDRMLSFATVYAKGRNGQSTWHNDTQEKLAITTDQVGEPGNVCAIGYGDTHHGVGGQQMRRAAQNILAAPHEKLAARSQAALKALAARVSFFLC